MGISEAGMFAAMKHATMSLNAHFNLLDAEKGQHGGPSTSRGKF